MDKNNIIGKSESHMISQTLTFRDGTDQWEVGPDRISDYTRYMTPNDDVSLEKFFERPILIGTYTWTPLTTPFFQALNPWALVVGNKRNVNRLNNYKILNANLNIKIVINGNPFYYGRLMADYVPLYSTATTLDLTGLTTLPNITASQRVHGFLDPTTSQGCTLKVPFVWFDNGVDITQADWGLLGGLYLREMNVLKHANASATPVTINVFGWLSEVSLSVPTSVNTTGLVVQASEIDMKPSTIASSAAGVFNKLSDVPVIGSYAKATSMVLGSLGGVAKLFGYSRPPVIDEPSAMRPSYIGELACVDKKENVVKLTADSRQELTIDSSVIGVKLPDELSIPYIASKESYFTNFAWTVAAGEGTCLWNVRVNPGMYDFAANSYYTTALSFASLPFRYWRGTIKYRFQIVASAYHKGRLLFLFDPNWVTGVETNTMYSRIVDLEKERDFTIDVAWAQPTAFLPVPPLGARFYSTTQYSSLNASSNGVLGVYVLNSLTTPNSVVNNDISINVFASGCEDIKFAEPYSENIKALQLTNQSEETDMPENAPTSQVADECMSQCVITPDINSVFFGESFHSFRALLKRYSYHASFTSPSTAAGRYTWVVNKSDYPVPRGVVTGGGFNALGLANYTVTTLLNYLTPAFVAQRGGVRYKYVFHEDASPTMSTVSVFRGVAPTYGNAVYLRPDTTADTYMKGSANGNYAYSANGAAVTVTQHQPVVEFELPYYRTYRFSNARDPSGRFANSPVSNGGHIVQIDTKFSATTDRTTFDSYVGVAEDFQLMWFQGCPPIKAYAIP